MISLFNEIGPLEILPNGKLTRRNVTWLDKFSLLFIDSPVGTGFSFVQQSKKSSSHVKGAADDHVAHYSANGYVQNQKAVSNDLLACLDEFYSLFPLQKSNKLYLAGESYAGKYIPNFATAILNRNSKIIEQTYSLAPTLAPSSLSSSPINLAGLAIGNGLTDPTSQILQHAPLAYSLGLISKKQSFIMDSIAKDAVEKAEKGDYLNALEARKKLFEFFSSCTGGINYYDVRKGDVLNSWEVMNTFLEKSSIKKAINVPLEVSFSKDPNVALHLAADGMKSATKAVEVEYIYIKQINI
jgi:vitellogenic carboxypeptidase-like protein